MCVMNTWVRGGKHRLKSEVDDLFISKMWSSYLCLLHRHFLTRSQCNIYVFTTDLPHLRHCPHVSLSTWLIRVSVPRKTHPRRDGFSGSLGSYNRIPQAEQLKEKTFFFSQFKREWKSKIMLPGGLVPGQSSLPGLQMASSCCFFTWLLFALDERYL